MNKSGFFDKNINLLSLFCRVSLAEGDIYFDDFLTHDNVIPDIPINIEEDVAILQYTGGTNW